MHFNSLTLATIAMSVTATALDASILTELPSCAQSPLISGIAASGCDVTNTECICGNTELLSSLKTSVAAACDAADQESECQFPSILLSALLTSLSKPSICFPTLPSSLPHFCIPLQHSLRTQKLTRQKPYP